MIWWLGSLASGALLIVLSRWLLRIAHPTEDMAAVERTLERASAATSGVWTVLWRAYGPITDEMRAAWARLRDRYQGGAYGTEGT